MVYVGDDWVEEHRDVHVMDEHGTRLAARRLPEGLTGIGGFHDLLATPRRRTRPGPDRHRNRSWLVGRDSDGWCRQPDGTEAPDYLQCGILCGEPPTSGDVPSGLDDCFNSGATFE